MAGGQEEDAPVNHVEAGPADGTPLSESVPAEERQAYIRGELQAHGLAGADGAYYSEVIPIKECVAVGAPMCSVGGKIFVGASAFNYQRGDFGSMLFHESIHVDQWHRGGVWRQKSDIMHEVRELDAYYRQMTPQNPYLNQMTPSVKSFYRDELMQSRLKVDNWLEHR